MNRYFFISALIIQLLYAPASQSQDGFPAKPEEQAEFIKIGHDGSEEAIAAPNQIRASQVMDKWGGIYCSSLLKIGHFDKWTGKIVDISDTGHFEVDLDGARFDSLIDPSDPMFAVISNLKIRQNVAVSGEIDRDYEQTTCRGWASIGDTVQVRFTDISPIK